MFNVPNSEKAFKVTPTSGENYLKGLQFLRFELDTELLEDEEYRKQLRNMINKNLKDCISVLGSWNTRVEQFDSPVPLTKSRAQYFGMPPNPQSTAGSIQMWKDVEKKCRMIESKLTRYENSL